MHSKLERAQVFMGVSVLRELILYQFVNLKQLCVTKVSQLNTFPEDAKASIIKHLVAIRGGGLQKIRE